VSVHTPAEEPRGACATNPALSSPVIASLFPAEAAAAELRVPGDPCMLEPEEAAAVARAVTKRAQEFAAGRLCARRALERFGVTRVVVRAASDRQPVWPPGFLGSITHTKGFCAAVVAERGALRGLGLDSEAADAVEARLWPSICVASELDWMGQWPAEARSRAATLVFAAKEAFYKAQYPSSGEFMSFSDLEVAPCGAQVLEGSLSFAPTRSLAVLAGDAQQAPQVRARYRFHEGFVSVGVALCAARVALDSAGPRTAD
jgi:4'-phosphopantetheinyl transferase EntD